MMKNPKLQFVGLLVAAAIWGLVIYRFVETPTTENYKQTNEAIVDSSAVVNSKRSADTFTLALDYEDPFLRGLSGASFSNETTGANSRQVKAQTRPKPQKPWPKMVYRGMVKSQASNTKIGILFTLGKSAFVEEKDALGELTILKIENDSIVVVRNGQRRTIHKNT